MIVSTRQRSKDRGGDDLGLEKVGSGEERQGKFGAIDV